MNPWLSVAEILDGPVFRGFYKGGNAVRPTRLTSQALDNILASYPLPIKGEAVIIRAMDLRRAYARLLHDADLSLAAIAANLGLKKINGVLDYIGPGAVGSRVTKPLPTDSADQ